MTGIIVACVKPVPLGEPRVSRGELVTEGMDWGLPGSERATVAAAGVAAKALGAEVVALAVGPEAAQAGLREALALGAKRAVRVDTGGQRLDAIMTARVLAAAIQRLGAPAAVVTGGESADAGQGLVGPMLAELLGHDALGGVERVEAKDGKLVLTAGSEGGVERATAEGPVVLGVAPSYRPAPFATSWGVGEAYDRKLETWALDDLGLDEGHLRPSADVAGLAKRERPRGEAERFEGDPEEATAQLVRRLRTAGVVR